MIRLKIDNTEVQVPEGVSVMTAARMKGFDIPSMCYREGKPHFTSCMICMVKDNTSGKLFPSCSVKVTEGMDIISRDEEVQESRRMALELLLSEHTGDCEAPCQVTCPAHMDIPLMNRLLAKGEFAEALQVVKRDIALPAVFGRICPAPCEGACRRKQEDEAVSICLLKRAAGDHDLEAGQPYLPKPAKSTGKKVSIIGAGPAGLAAAYYLQLRGHECDVYDRHAKPGGTLWREVDAGNLESDVLEKEIRLIEKTGVKFQMEKAVDDKLFQSLTEKTDAVLIAIGEITNTGKSGTNQDASGRGSKADSGKSQGVDSRATRNNPSGIPGIWGLKMGPKGIDAQKKTYVTSIEGVFAAGAALRPSKLAIRTLGQGKEAAFSIDQFLKGEKVQGEPFLFNSRFGKLLSSEVVEYMKEAKEGPRLAPGKSGEGLTAAQVQEEAARCMHCDCRAIDDCKLRTLSHEYQANQKHYWNEERKTVQKVGLDKAHVQHDLVVFEPNKCIKCGICVHITEEHKEKYGMSFIGRGFDVVVSVPFNEALKDGLAMVAEKVVKSCPTGALSDAMRSQSR